MSEILFEKLINKLKLDDVEKEFLADARKIQGNPFPVIGGFISTLYLVRFLKKTSRSMNILTFVIIFIGILQIVLAIID